MKPLGGFIFLFQNRRSDILQIFYYLGQHHSFVLSRSWPRSCYESNQPRFYHDLRRSRNSDCASGRATQSHTIRIYFRTLFENAQNIQIAAQGLRLNVDSPFDLLVDDGLSKDKFAFRRRPRIRIFDICDVAKAAFVVEQITVLPAGKYSLI